jgi:hypothetical protein
MEINLDNRRQIFGTLDHYFETGTEGSYYSLDDISKTGYDALNTLKNGDYLQIIENEIVIWQGEIAENKTINLAQTAYSYQRQVVNGLIVQWIQDGINPELWHSYFTKKLSAVLYPI